MIHSQDTPMRERTCDRCRMVQPQTLAQCSIWGPRKWAATPRYPSFWGWVQRGEVLFFICLYIKSSSIVPPPFLALFHPHPFRHTSNMSDIIKKEELEHIENIEQLDELTVPASEEKALVRKIDLFLLPCIWLMYLLSYMDRTK